MTSEWTIKSPGDCRYNEVSLGEVMLRLDPGQERIHTARTFRSNDYAWLGYWPQELLAKEYPAWLARVDVRPKLAEAK